MNSDSIDDLLPPLPCAASVPEPHIDARARMKPDNHAAALPADFYNAATMEASE